MFMKNVVPSNTTTHARARAALDGYADRRRKRENRVKLKVKRIKLQ